jgi:hypothetical protein
MQTSRYEDIAQSFLNDHPIGTPLTGERLLSWIEEKANGHVIGGDLTIEEPRKKLSTLRRHLNEGARTQNVAENRRFIITVEDAKRLKFVVVGYAQHVHEQAGQAFVRSAGGALAPINSALKALDDIKIDELPEDRQREVEKDRQGLETIKEPVRRAYVEEADRRMVTALIDRGQSPEQARTLLASMQTLEPYQKLLRKLS